jgi:hypothetical protein
MSFLAEAHGGWDLGLILKILFLLLTGFAGVLFKVFSVLKSPREVRKPFMDGSELQPRRPSSPDREKARRRLAEALGVPEHSGGHPIRPVQPQSHTMTMRRRSGPSSALPPQVPVSPRVSGEEGPVGRAADLHFPEMQVAPVPRLETVASRVTAFSDGKPDVPMRDAFDQVKRVGNEKQWGGIRARLSNREGIREAFVISEVLGKPRGLQS